MKKGKKDRKVVQKVRLKNRDVELEMRELLHDLLLNKKMAKQKN